MLKKIGAVIFYIALFALGIFLYMIKGFYLYIPLVIIIIAVSSAVILKRYSKQQKARIEKMYADGILKDKLPKPINIDYNVLTEITMIIPRNDIEIVSKISECVKDHITYFNNQKTEFGERGIDNIDKIDKEEFCWLCMVNTLISRNYACEIDWKTETEDIFYNLEFIVKKLQIPIDLENIEKSIPEEFFTDKALQKISCDFTVQNYALGQIDIESDSYVLFITYENQKDKLTELSEKYGRRISFNF